MYYLIILLVYAAVDAMACLGLSQQFGVAGVTNFGFIIFQAAGAYVAAVLALPFTFLVGRRLRGDFAAVGLLVTAVLLNLLVMNYRPLFNGDAGTALVPAPLRNAMFVTTSNTYQFGFAAGGIAATVAVYWLVRRITESPYGRSLRAMRDNDKVADSLGKNLRALRTGALVTGGAIAGLSGAMLVSFIGVWSPAAWSYAETIVLFTAIIIGGAGNHVGAVLGAVLVPVGFEEITRFISNNNPTLPPNLLPSLQWVAIGLLIAVFLWARPQGVLPERKRVIPGTAAAREVPAAAAVGELPAAGAVGELPAAGALSESPAAAAAPVVSVRKEPADQAAARTVSDRTASDGTASDRSGSDRTGADVLADRAAATPAEPILRTVGVSKEFGGVHAVAGVTMSVGRGTLTGLIGPNGAGKSTLLALLAGTEKVSAGQIIYQGSDITGVPAFRRARSGLVRTFQLASEFRRLTVLENLLCAVPGNRGDSFAGALAGRRYWRGDEDRAIARAQDLIGRFGLARHANDYAGELSGGQRRLVEIMRALMAEPDMLLLDEPMAGVHPELARRIGDALTALCRDGMTILMVEHELAIMDEFCDPVIVMAEGSVLAEGTMTELRDRTEVVEAYLVG